MSSDDGSSDEGRLAEQLGDLEVDVSDDESASSDETVEATRSTDHDDEQGDSAAASEADAVDAETAGAETSGGTESLDDEELFRRAVRDLDGDSLRDEKFDEVDDERADWAGDLEHRDAPSDYGSDSSDAETSDPEGGTPVGEGAREASPSQMMEAALEDLDEEEIRDRKFDDAVEGTETADPPGGSSRRAAESTDDSSGGETDEMDEQEAREELKRRRERRQFEAAVRDVDEIDASDKRHRVEAPDPSEMFDENDRRTERTAEDFTTPTLPRSGEALDAIPALDDAQESLLDRFEESEVPEGPVELNLRGSTERQAIHRLRGFVREAWERNQRFVRIVHGRGRRSDGLPVLKPAVLEWLESDGAAYVRGYAPERQPGGSYGSLVVELLARGPE